MTAQRVVFVAPFGLRQKGTVTSRTLPLARALVAHGYEPVVLIPPWDSPEDSGRQWQDEGASVQNVSIQGGVGPTVARLLRAIDAIKPDIVHIVKPRAHAGIVQWLLWQRRRTPARTRSAGPRILLDVDDWEQAWSPINQYGTMTGRFLAWQEEWGLRHADGITAASHWLVDKALGHAHATPVLYLPNGVAPFDISHTVAPRLDGPPLALYFTRYVEVAPEWLAEMAEDLLAAAPDARLVIAGNPLRPDGDQAFRAAFATRTLASSSRVAWLGSVEPSTIPGLFAAAHVALFPASPVPLQEAKCSVRLATTLAAGVPVVASAVGEQRWFGANGAARLVEADATPAEFASAISEVLASPATRTAMAQRARQHMHDDFLWPDLGSRLARYYATFSPTLPQATAMASADT